MLLMACGTSAVPAASPPFAAAGPAAREQVAWQARGAGAAGGPRASTGRDGSGVALRPATVDDAEGGPGGAGVAVPRSTGSALDASPPPYGGGLPARSAATADRGSTRSASAAATKPGPYALDLFRRGDFVRQYTFDWCVGASIQMMLNMIRPVNETSRARQQAIWELARDLSSSPYRGANPRGWTEALNQLGAGAYALVAVRDYGDALRTAAAAIRETRRPVGLVMWGGRHAWVMSGFTSSADPRATPGFVVTGVRVMDPLYPYGSSQWGASPVADTLLRPSQLDDQFVPRHRRRPPSDGQPDYAPEGSYVLVLPVQ
jgi:hypothetical protein